MPSRAALEPARVDEVRSADLGDVHGELRVLPHEYPGRAGVVEVDVRQEEVAQVGDGDAELREARTKRLDRRRRPAVVERWPLRRVEQVGTDHALAAEVAQVDQGGLRHLHGLYAPSGSDAERSANVARHVRLGADGERSAPVTPNYEQAFTEHPDVLAAWLQLNGAIKDGMDLRRYELATLAAARRLRSSYCCLAHGSVLLERFQEPVREIALDHRAAGLDESDVAVMDLAERVVDDATSIVEGDLQRLRDLGLPEQEISGVVLAASARCFFAKTLDALGIRADAKYNDLDPDVREALVVGRPIAEV